MPSVLVIHPLLSLKQGTRPLWQYITMSDYDHSEQQPCMRDKAYISTHTHTHTHTHVQTLSCSVP